MLKIYSYDRGYEGVSVVVASTPEEAVGILNENGVRLNRKGSLTVDDLNEHPIRVGHVLDNMGDA